MAASPASLGAHAGGNPTAAPTPLFTYVLALADDALVLGHRLSEWSGKAPMLEEDIALSNLALDLIGQARLYYAYAGEIEGKGRSRRGCARLPARRARLQQRAAGRAAERRLRRHHGAPAALRGVHAPLSAGAAEVRRYAPRRDRGQGGQGDGLSRAPRRRVGDPTGRRHRGEPRARRRRARTSCGRTPASCSRWTKASAALVREGVAVDRETIRPIWEATLDRVLGEATLARARPTAGCRRAAASGRHSEHLGHLLAEMQVLHRAHPGATW